MATRLRWVNGRFNTSEARAGTFRLTVSYASTRAPETGKPRWSIDVDGVRFDHDGTPEEAMVLAESKLRERLAAALKALGEES